MNVLYHPGKANVSGDSLSRMSMGSTAHVEDYKKELVKDIYRLGVQLVHSTSRGVSVHPSSESFLVVEVKEGQHLNPVLMELKVSVLLKMNESFALRGDDILRYQDSHCVPEVKTEYLKPGGLTQIIEVPTLKWEDINIDFVIGLLMTRRQHGSI
ncbi:uncharacterized protein [Solanum lycopersicum]|uniref:uncharacterized protein n=1 Tax=Solanum lycopersicum TaxID=4081 RepID=UPI003749E04D